MEYDWIGMNHVPPASSSTPISKDAFIKDLNLVGQRLTQQVKVDTPRHTVYLQGIRVRNGNTLEHLVRNVLCEKEADAALAMCTQTTLAAPLRALTTSLFPHDLYIGEQEPRGTFVAQINIVDYTHVTVLVKKSLDVVRPGVTKPRRFRHIKLEIKYSTDKPFVMIELTSEKIRDD